MTCTVSIHALHFSHKRHFFLGKHANQKNKRNERQHLNLTWNLFWHWVQLVRIKLNFEEFLWNLLSHCCCCGHAIQWRNTERSKCEKVCEEITEMGSTVPYTSFCRNTANQVPYFSNGKFLFWRRQNQTPRAGAIRKGFDEKHWAAYIHASRH